MKHLTLLSPECCSHLSRGFPVVSSKVSDSLQFLSYSVTAREGGSVGGQASCHTVLLTGGTIWAPGRTPTLAWICAQHREGSMFKAKANTKQ